MARNHSSISLSIIFFFNKVIIPYKSRFSFVFCDLVVVLVRRVVVVILVQHVVVIVLVQRVVIVVLVRYLFVCERCNWMYQGPNKPHGGPTQSTV